MKSFSTTTMIQASPEAVWACLTDIASWPGWYATVVRVEGSLAVGQTIRMTTKSGRSFYLKVTQLMPNQRMVLTGETLLTLFKGERTYLLTARSEGVEFWMEEVFSGLLAPLITPSIPNLQPSFDEFAAALKQHVEQSVQSP